MTAPSPSPRPRPVPAADTAVAEPQVHVGHGSAATVVIGVSGELDLATGPSVEARVLAAVDTAAGGRVVLDLNAVGFLGLRGVAMLRAAADRARATGASLVVVLDPTAPAARALRLVRGPGLTVVAVDAPVADAS
ncbi:MULTISPECIES: STAS domain-containing protein [unclassified Pseudonocardia]|uniref:STAS domain-containing protein n=1 Tax=unclassified Pseudonocardia TaxID=2619320 RepID=UPI001CF6A492|nr:MULTISPECIES: STAS domain-containing protein [unclassified Pseudonocardia]